MDNEEVVAALDEVFDIQAIISGELDYCYNEQGQVVITAGWPEVVRMLEIMDEVSPYLGVIQNLLGSDHDLEL